MRRLGGGTAYEAYLAFDEVTYAPVVVKVVRPDQVDDEHSLRGLRREVAALAAVNHPVVVRGLRHELDGERPHVVLEHVDGPRLSTLIRRYGPLQEQQYLPLAIDVASALHYLRDVGLAHLDIKPSNIIMGAPARLIDLSVARRGRATPPADRTRIGTDAYMSPEQCDPDRHGDARPAPATCGAWAPRCSRRSPATGRSTTATATPTTSPERSRSSWTSPTSCPTRVPAEVAKVLYAALEPRPRQPPAAARGRRGPRAGPGPPAAPCGSAASRSTAVEPVAHAAHGGDRVGAELLAQVADVDVDDVRAGVEVVAPHVVEQLLAGEHLAGVHA